jgi:hypothetical protein
MGLLTVALAAVATKPLELAGQYRIVRRSNSDDTPPTRPSRASVPAGQRQMRWANTMLKPINTSTHHSLTNSVRLTRA